MVEEITSTASQIETSPLLERNLVTSSSFDSMAVPAHLIDFKNKPNEDYGVANDITGVLIVADGMGGGVAGGECSRLATSFLEKEMTVLHGDPKMVGENLVLLLQQASNHVAEGIKGQLKEGETRTAATTVTVCKVVRHEDGLFGVFAWVGDSPAYLIRERKLFWMTDLDSGQIRQIVKNKGLTGEQALEESKRLAAIVDEIDTVNDFIGLDEDSRNCFNNRHLLSEVLGLVKEGYVPPVHTSIVQLQAGDKIGIMTDGYSDALTRQEIVKGIDESESVSSMKHELLLKRADRSSLRVRRPDDATMILMKVEEKGKVKVSEAPVKQQWEIDREERKKRGLMDIPDKVPDKEVTPRLKSVRKTPMRIRTR